MTGIGVRAALALAVALPLALGAASPAAAGESGEPVLHIGIRQAAVGEPVPVTIVGAAPGSTWEIRERASGAALAVLTVGADRSGTAMVSLPTATRAGDAELLATGPGRELSAPLTVAAAPGQAAAGAPVRPDRGDPLPIVLIGTGAAAAAGVAVAGGVLLRRRRRPGATR